MNIKFRAWDRINEKWYPSVKGEWINIMQNGEIVTGFDCDIDECDGIFDIQQYIGFEDKNGKMIYEGDIVYHSYFREQGVVEFYKPRGAFMLRYKDGKHQELYPIDKDSFEVIGNIYENPELLRRKHGKEKQGQKDNKASR